MVRSSELWSVIILSLLWVSVPTLRSRLVQTVVAFSGVFGCGSCWQFPARTPILWCSPSNASTLVGTQTPLDPASSSASFSPSSYASDSLHARPLPLFGPSLALLSHFRARWY